MDELSEEDKQIVYRARKMQRFLAQPFFVAEVFTGMKGKFVPVKETIESFKSILEGKYDHLPEMAFYMVGGIEEVEAKAKALAGDTAVNKDDKKKDAAPTTQGGKPVASLDEVVQASREMAAKLKEKELKGKSSKEADEINTKWAQWEKDLEVEVAQMRDTISKKEAAARA